MTATQQEGATEDRAAIEALTKAVIRRGEFDEQFVKDVRTHLRTAHCTIGQRISVIQVQTMTHTICLDLIEKKTYVIVSAELLVESIELLPSVATEELAG